jgi:hypothetical protein
MAEEAAKPKPNATRAGLYREQLAAQTRFQDRDDAIARDQQRIELEQLRKDHIGYKSQIAELEKKCESWLTECDGLRAKLIQVEASAAHDLAHCPSCVRLEKENQELRGPAELWIEQERAKQAVAEKEERAKRAIADKEESAKREREQVEREKQHYADTEAQVKRIKSDPQRPRPSTWTQDERRAMPWHQLHQLEQQEAADKESLAEWDRLQTRKTAEEAALHAKYEQLRKVLGDKQFRTQFGDKKFQEQFGDGSGK